MMIGKLDQFTPMKVVVAQTLNSVLVTTHFSSTLLPLAIYIMRDTRER
jgi:hypothetical protein